jgi:urocanate hydratase
MAENNIDFRYPSYVQDIMGLCVLILVWAFRWVCASGNQRFTKKQILLPARYWKKWQNSSIEIQQQMQDIQWIKAQENKLAWGLKLILYADAEGRVKLLNF